MRGERGVDIQDSRGKSYVDKELFNLKSDHRVPITNKRQNLMLLLSAEKQYPPNVLWSLNHSLAFSLGPLQVHLSLGRAAEQPLCCYAEKSDQGSQN